MSIDIERQIIYLQPIFVLRLSCVFKLGARDADETTYYIRDPPLPRPSAETIGGGIYVEKLSSVLHMIGVQSRVYGLTNELLSDTRSKAPLLRRIIKAERRQRKRSAENTKRAPCDGARGLR